MFRYLLILCLLTMLLVGCGSDEPATENEVAVADNDDHENDEDHDDEEHHDEDDHDDGEDHHDDEAHDDDEKHPDDEAHDDEEHHEDEEHHDDEAHDEDDHDDHDEHREHDAHEHGAAELTIAWSGDTLAIDLSTPAFNVLGFEYAPSTDEEQAFATESVAILEEGAFMHFSESAECAIVSAEVHAGFEEAVEDDGETHSDIDAEYSVECEHPADLTELDLSDLFAQFSNFEDLQVQWISDTNQSAETLTPDNTILSFE